MRGCHLRAIRLRCCAYVWSVPCLPRVWDLGTHLFALLQVVRSRAVLWLPFRSARGLGCVCAYAWHACTFSLCVFLYHFPLSPCRHTVRTHGSVIRGEKRKTNGKRYFLCFFAHLFRFVCHCAPAPSHGLVGYGVQSVPCGIWAQTIVSFWGWNKQKVDGSNRQQVGMRERRQSPTAQNPTKRLLGVLASDNKRKDIFLFCFSDTVVLCLPFPIAPAAPLDQPCT